MPEKKARVARFTACNLSHFQKPAQPESPFVVDCTEFCACASTNNTQPKIKIAIFIEANPSHFDPQRNDQHIVIVIAKRKPDYRVTIAPVILERCRVRPNHLQKMHLRFAIVSRPQHLIDRLSPKITKGFIEKNFRGMVSPKNTSTSILDCRGHVAQKRKKPTHLLDPAVTPIKSLIDF